jgi:putative membrane protein insertion efficiency factor
MKVINDVFQWLFILLIKIYQWFLSPFLGASCRFNPTCSQYGIEAIKKYGPFKGGWLTSAGVIPGVNTGTILFLKTIHYAYSLTN